MTIAEEIAAIWRAGERSRRAYYAEQEIAAQRCANGCGRRATEGRRLCWTCRKEAGS